MYMSSALFLGPRSFYIIIESAVARCISDTLRSEEGENGWRKEDEEKKKKREKEKKK